MTRIEPAENFRSMTPTSRWFRKTALDFWNSQDSSRNHRVPLKKIKESLINSDQSDRIPNALAIELMHKADENDDGHLDYEEYMKFSEAASRYSKTRDNFSKAALAVIPRNERTLKKRTYLQQFSCWPPPIFMPLVTIAEVGVFIFYWIDMKAPMGAAGPAPIYSPLIYNPFRRHEAWRFMSYALIHSGYMHLLNNLLVQGVLGILLELVHGGWRIGFIYLNGVLFGSLAHSLANRGAFLAGASGGVFAVEYAHLGNLLLNWSQMQSRWIQLVVLVILIVFDFSFAIWDSYFSGAPTRTGHFSHLGGAVAGILVGIYVLRNLKKKRWERCCWWISFLLYAGLVATGIFLNLFPPIPFFFPPKDTSGILQVRNYARG